MAFAVGSGSRWKCWSRAAAVLLVAVAGACLESNREPAATAPARPSAGDAAAEADQGRVWFEAYCSACHGQDAKGSGRLAGTLRSPPADLTRIAERHGVFDRDRVASYIDGRTDVVLHGPREMPVWSRKLDDRLEGSLEEEMRLTPRMIAEIVAYLETRQASDRR